MKERRNLKEIYDEIAEDYNKIYSSEENLPHLDLVDEFLKRLKKGKTILDAGCGPGCYSKYFVKRGFKVIGIDISKKMIELARRNVKEANFFIMDVKNFKIDKKVDGIFCAYVLQHMDKEELKEYIKCFKNNLREGGYLFIILYRGKGEKIIREPLNPKIVYKIYLYEEKELKEILEKEGFEIEKIWKKKNEDKAALHDKEIIILAKLKGI